MSRAPEQANKPPGRRLLIGFNHYVECRSVLSCAAQVSQAAGAELAGIFVEDEELLGLARLPFSVETLYSSRQTRNLDCKSMEGELRAIAMQMHNALRKLAEGSSRQYSFRTVRGHLYRALAGQAGAGDLILLRSACIPWRRARPAMPAMNGPVMLLKLPGGGNGNLLALAQEIARAMKQELILLHRYEGPQILRSMNAGLIILPASLFNADTRSSEIERFTEAAPCPVLLVPAAG